MRYRLGALVASGLLVLALGATAIVRIDITERRERFLADARTAHRVLSQSAAGVDAILGTLVLLAAPSAGERAAQPSEKLIALYPQVLGVWRRDAGEEWTGPAPAPDRALLAGAEQRSSALPPPRRHAALAAVEPERGRYTLVLAGTPSSFAMQVDALQLAATSEWPWRSDSAVRVTLTRGDATLVLQPGAAPDERPSGLTQGFEASKTLTTPSQPFALHAQRFTGPAEWPWRALALWAIACLAAAALAYRWQEARRERRRAAERMRLAQVARLGTLGELAAGIAHELNQPLTAVLASTQTALRLLRQEGDAVAATTATAAGADSAAVVQALELGASQARRAAEVVARLRRLVQQPASPDAASPVDLAQVARRLVDLLGAELAQRSIEVAVLGSASAARADPVAVEQILHNLLGNAMQALEASAHRPRTIAVEIAEHETRVACTVRDNGAGIAEEALPRLFEPFYTTRAGGLGLGLPLAQSLALAMDGTLEARRGRPRGAEFILELPLAARECEGATQ